MNLINRSALVVAFVFACAAMLQAPLAHAAAPELTLTETVANLAVGTNNQTIATTTGTANVAETKATRTITVTGNFNGTVNASSVTLTIGTCAITITASPAADTDCSNNTAAVATSTNTTASAIAGAIRSITNISDTGHGALTVGGSSATASFTTTGTEASATAVTATLSAGTDITLTTVNTTGVIPVAQVTRATPANVEVGDLFSVLINATTVSFTATAATVANVTAGLTAAVNASAVASAVTASDQTTRVDITADTAGTAFTTNTTGTTNRSAVAQTITITPAVLAGGTYTVTINGTARDFSVDLSEPTPTTKQVVEGLAAALAAETAVSCSEDDTTITCVATTPGTAFTYAWSVSGYSTHSSGGGGGGGSRSSSNDDSAEDDAGESDTAVSGLMARIAQLKAALAALTGSSPGTPPAPADGSFTRDLDLGAEGADVTALQNWLIGKGHPIPAGATGYFGAQTQAALAAWQAANGITPAAGYFGPKTRSMMGQ